MACTEDERQSLEVKLDAEEAVEIEDDEINDRTLLCGWGKWRPGLLQVLSRPSVFLFFIFTFAMTAGIFSGLTSVNLPEIEKEFGLSSKQSAIILLSNDIGGIIFLPIISFYGTHAKKPKWMGSGALICGIGALLMVLPKLMIGKYTIPGAIGNGGSGPNTCVTGLMNPLGANSCSGNQGFESSTKYLSLFCLAQFIFGIGLTPLWPLAPAYLDENVNPKNAPIYVGIWFVSAFLGRGLGYLVGGAFLGIFTDLVLPAGISLSRKDTRWIGAWWLGFFISACVMVISGAILLCFPRKMPKYQRKRVIAMKEGKLPIENKDIGKSFKDLFKALADLLKNKTYMFSSLALAIKIIFAAALGGFYVKVFVLKFGGTFSKAALYSAGVFIPGNTFGTIIGSYFLKKMPLKNAAKNSLLILIICSLIASFMSAIWLMPGCNTTNVAGTVVPYAGSLNLGSLKSKCNSDCKCSQKAYEPICGKDGVTYFSPCFAGCQFKNKNFAGNCSCVATSTTIKLNSTSANMTSSATASSGRCDRSCKNLFLFLAFSALLLMISFFGSVPQKMLSMRCVPDNQRAFGLGIQLIFLRLFSFIPGPLILGSIIDANCLVWSVDECGNRGNCLEYEVDRLSMHFFIFALSATVTSLLLYFCAWYFYVPLPTAKIVKDNNENIDNKGLLGGDEKAQENEAV